MQEEDEDSAVLKTILEAEKAPKLSLILKNDLSDSDSNELDINITKVSLRLEHQYFTAEEAEVSEPLIIDEENITTNSSSSLEDRDNNSNKSFNANGDKDDLRDHMIDE